MGRDAAGDEVVVIKNGSLTTPTTTQVVGASGTVPIKDATQFGDGVTSGTLAVTPEIYDPVGAGYVRQRGDTTGNTLVDAAVFSNSRKTADGQVKSGVGRIHTVSIAPTTAAATAGLVTIYDSLTETGTILYSEWIFATTPGHTIILDNPITTGIFVGFDATLANVSVTVSYL